MVRRYTEKKDLDGKFSTNRDDVFYVWTHGLPKLLLEFTECINSLLPPLLNLSAWYILSIPSMSWILNCTFKMGLLLRIFTLSLRIAFFICSSAKGRFLMELLYVLDPIVPPDVFLNRRWVEYKGYLKSQGYNTDLVYNQFDRALSIERS